MAVLGATSLTGCTSIPSFMGTGARTTFRMATVPVSWTKDTTVNTGTLRVVNGTASPGGSLIWDQIFATRPYTSSTQGATDGCSVNQATTNLTLLQVNFAQTNTGSTATSLAQMGPHTHSVAAGRPGSTTLRVSTALGLAQGVQPVATGAYGQGGTHSHTVSSQHSHPGPGNRQHNHTISGQHSHPGYAGSVDFNLTYVDVIVAVKD